MRIELAELQRITSRSHDIESELSTQFGNMITELEDLAANLKSSDLIAANRNLVQAITELSNKVNARLPEITAFLETQTNAYAQTNAETKDKIDSLVTTINSSFGSNQ